MVPGRRLHRAPHMDAQRTRSGLPHTRSAMDVQSRNDRLGFLLGYVLHIVADSVSGGVPIFYPLSRKRLGIRLVHTGSWADHGMGAVAMLLALGALFL